MTKNILKQECEAYCAPECEVIAITAEDAIASSLDANTSISDWSEDEDEVPFK